MCLDDSHEYAKQELFKAVRLFMVRNSVSAAMLQDGEIMIYITDKEYAEKLGWPIPQNENK